MSPKKISFRALSIALAVVLTVTATLKLHQLLTDPFADIKSGMPLPFFWLAIFTEAGVVWIIASKATEQLKWLALISLFAAMSCVSAYNVLIGKTSCGCLGAFLVSPLFIFCFDFFVVVSLALRRPSKSVQSQSYCSLKNKTQRLSRSMSQIVGVLIGLCPILFLETTYVKSILFFLGGIEPIVASPVLIKYSQDVKNANCNVVLTNRSEYSCRIVGAKESCSCVKLTRPPTPLIPPNGQLNLDIFVDFENLVSRANFHQRILVFLDSPKQHVVVVDVFAESNSSHKNFFARRFFLESVISFPLGFWVLFHKHYVGRFPNQIQPQLLTDCCVA